MSEQKPPPDPLLKNPQVIAALIGGVITIVVAVIGIVPGLINATKPPPETVVITQIGLITTTPVPDVPTTEPSSPATAEPISVVATVTPLQISTAVSSPTPVLPSISNALLLFDDVSFTLLNQSAATLSLEEVIFHSENGDWEARSWGPSVYDKLPAGKCLRLRDAAVGQRQPPNPCVNNIYGLQEVGKTALFWVGVTSFDVLRNGQLLTTCQTSTPTCAINIT